MLKNDAHRHASALGDLHKFAPGGAVTLQRLFEKNVFSRSCRRGDDLLAGIGWGKDDHGIDIVSRKKLFERTGGGNAPFFTENLETLGIAIVDAPHLSDIAKIFQGTGVDASHHAYTYDSDS